jgi:hippurate hydrolase
LSRTRGPIGEKQPTRADLYALKAYPKLIAIRHDIHRHPGTGFEQIRTARVIADKLRGWGIYVGDGTAETGVVGTICGALACQRAIGPRANLDALHIEETPDRAHRSTVPENARV